MKDHKKVVIKIGTKVLTSAERTLDKERIASLVSQIAGIKARGIDVILVTSGAIGAGMGLLGLKKRPSELADLQACASIGQSYLMHLYGEYFKAEGYIVGQILLTQEDFNDRARYLNIKHTVAKLLEHKAVPIINENDTVATEEIKCGDNDRISCLVSDLCGADKLIILTDVDGLLDADGNVISEVEEIGSKVLKLAGRTTCDLGTGGMASKIECAKTVIDSGIECIIANGKKKDILQKVIGGERVGTHFKSGKAKYLAKKRWIAYSSRSKGRLVVDDGAVSALYKNKSLLASGIKDVEGHFAAQDIVSVVDREGKVVAKGLSNYSSHDMMKIKGLKSSGFKSALGREGADEAIHKDNLVIL